MSSGELPAVSVIIPVYNEQRYIAQCLNSIIAGTYPKEKLEILVIDGASTDNTRTIVRDFCQEYDFVRVVDNPARLKPVALNIGLREARGEIVIRMDAHARYDRNYVTNSVECLNTYENAGSVGGVRKTLAGNETLLARSIALAISHPFAVGNATYRTGTKKAQWVDVVFGFCCRKKYIEQIGFFDERLVRGQDREFNFRIRRSGRGLLLSPEIVSYYFARDNLLDYTRWIYEGGSVPTYISRLTGKNLLSWRNLVPMAFVVCLMGLMVFGVVSPIARVGLIMLGGSYMLLAIYFAFRAARSEKQMGFLVVLPLIFALTHVMYGIGSIVGLLKRVERGGSSRIYVHRH